MTEIDRIRLSREDHELVTTIADAQSVTRAAERMHVSQSALSHHLRALESTLGCELFIREPRRMLLTEHGRNFITQSARVLAGMRAADAAIVASVRTSSPVVIVGTECYTSYHWLPALAEEVGSAISQVQLRLKTDATRRVVAALLAGEIDLAVLNRTDRHPDLTYTRLLTDEIVLLVPVAHALSAKRHVVPSDLEGQRLVLHETHDGKHPLLDDFLNNSGVQFNVEHLQLTEALVELVKAGHAITALAKWMIGPHLLDHRLKALRIGPKGLHRDWLLASRRSDPRAKKFAELGEALGSKLRKKLK